MYCIFKINKVNLAFFTGSNIFFDLCLITIHNVLPGLRNTKELSMYIETFTGKFCIRYDDY